METETETESESEETPKVSESGLSQARVSEADQQPPSNVNFEQEEESCRAGKQSEETAPVTQGKEIFKAIEVMERDSLEIAQSYTSLFASLRLALSQVTSTSVDHMSCFSDAAGCLQECALDAATKGNRYINSCLRLNEEMKGIENLASQLKILRRNADALDSAVNKMVRLP